MLPFIRHTFEYPASADPAKCLIDTLSQAKWSGIRSAISRNKLTLVGALPIYFHNSWNPVFQGSIETDGGRPRLTGYFRVHWFVMVFITVFVGMAVFQLLQTYFSPEVVPGFVENWRAKRLHFDLTFLCLAIGINVVGWLFGIPNQRRILAAIQESTRA